MKGYPFRGGNFVKNCLPPSEKGSAPKRKEFAPNGSKFFPFRGDPFQKGLNMQESKQEV